MGFLAYRLPGSSGNGDHYLNQAHFNNSSKIFVVLFIIGYSLLLGHSKKYFSRNLKQSDFENDKS